MKPCALSLLKQPLCKPGAPRKITTPLQLQNPLKLSQTFLWNSEAIQAPLRELSMVQSMCSGVTITHALVNTTQKNAPWYACGRYLSRSFACSSLPLLSSRFIISMSLSRGRPSTSTPVFARCVLCACTCVYAYVCVRVYLDVYVCVCVCACVCM
jgi:hypothetical protein